MDPGNLRSRLKSIRARGIQKQLGELRPGAGGNQSCNGMRFIPNTSRGLGRGDWMIL